MLAALAGEKALAADETPVNVLDSSAPQPAAQEEQEQDPEEEKAAAGAPHVLIVRTPDGRLTWLQALASRRARSEIRQAAPGRLRLLAFARHPRPLVPHQKLPRLSRPYRRNG